MLGRWVAVSAHQPEGEGLGWRRTVIAVLGALTLAGCGSSGKGPVTLNWYVFPEPSGSFAAAASGCSKASGGAYRIKINFLSPPRISSAFRSSAGWPPT